MFDPTLPENAVIEAKDEDKIPPDYRVVYEKGEDGKFKFNVPDPKVASVLKLALGYGGALERARKEVKDLKDAPKIDLTPLKSFGNTPEEIAENFTKTKTTLEGQIKSVNVENLRKGIIDEYEPKVKSATARADSFQAQLHEVLVVNQAQTAIAAAEGDLEMVSALIGKYLKPVEENGKYVVKVVDTNGDVRYKGANAMTIADLVAEVKANEKYGVLFKSKAPNGTGSTTTAVRRATVNKQNVAEMRPVDKIKAALDAARGR